VSARRLAFYRRAVEILRWLRLGLGACVIVGVSYLLFSWVVAGHRTSVAEAALVREHNESKLLREQVNAAQQLASRHPRSETDGSEALTPAAIAELNQSAAALGNSGLSVRPVMPAESEGEESSAPVGVEMSMHGSFESSYAFLRHLHDQAVPITFELIEWRPQPESVAKGRMSVQLRLAVVEPEG
jgi:hypothetical protein